MTSGQRAFFHFITTLGMTQNIFRQWFLGGWRGYTQEGFDSIVAPRIETMERNGVQQT